MPPRTRKTATPKIAFVLTEQKFRQLTALIEELTKSDDTEYTVRLSDNSSITCESTDEVLGIQNSRDRQITSIWIETSYRSDPRIQVKLSQTYLEPVNYEVSGNEKDVFHSSARLDEYFSGLRQWYSLIVSAGLKLGFVYFAIVLLLSLLFYFWLLDLLGISLTDNNGESSDYEVTFLSVTLAALFVLVPLAMPWLLISALDRLRKWLFPNGTFAIGDGLDRHNNLVATRKLIGGGVILALAISLLGSLIYAQIS